MTASRMKEGIPVTVQVLREIEELGVAAGLGRLMPWRVSMPDLERGTLYVIDPKDNVAIALLEIPEGAATFAGEETGTLLLKETIPFGNKAALCAIKKSELVIKHGYPIAIATKDIAQGAWVHVHNAQSRFDNQESNQNAAVIKACSPGGQSMEVR